MIPQTIATWQTSTWKEELRDAVTNVGDLLALVKVQPDDLDNPALAASPFPLRVPMSFIARMESGNPRDPLLLQVLPQQLEQREIPGFLADPLEETDYNPAPGVIHKYNGRALLITTPVCAVNCRYCFRRHFPYSENNPGKKQWQESLSYITRDETLSEVILSGGDPLATSDQHLAWLVGEIEHIPHIRRLRIHTRLPVVIPSRVDDALVNWLGKTHLQTVVVLHINHPREINGELAEAVARLRCTGAQILNQAVLLKGINDCPATLVELSEALFASGILPYYLHTLDKVTGAGHFAISDREAVALHEKMRENLPGYLVPQLVRDVPGKPSKVPITTHY